MREIKLQIIKIKITTRWMKTTVLKTKEIIGITIETTITTITTTTEITIMRDIIMREIMMIETNKILSTTTIKTIQESQILKPT